MLKHCLVANRARIIAGLALAALLGVAFQPSQFSAPVTAQQSQGNVITPAIPVIPPGSAYRQTNLVSDIPGLAPMLDPLLVNPWGISMTASSPFWVANNGTSTSQLLRGDVSGSPFILNASMPTVTIPGSPGLPTGTVANGVSTEFVLPGACASAPCGANFLFASITGNILGWDPNAPAAGSTTAVIAVHPPNASPSHPPAAPAIPNVYTGLAIANNGSGFSTRPTFPSAGSTYSTAASSFSRRPASRSQIRLSQRRRATISTRSTFRPSAAHSTSLTPRSARMARMKRVSATVSSASSTQTASAI